VLKLVALAQLVGQRLLHDRASIDDVASEQGMTTSYVSLLVRITSSLPTSWRGSPAANTIPLSRRDD
jgi:hypothetical protein